MTSAGFEVKMVGSDPWYFHKQTGDAVKFFPNDTAKILFVKTNNKVVITKKIDDALVWIKSHFTAGMEAVSPLVSAKGQKAGEMYNKIFTNAGFEWDEGTGTYIQTLNKDFIEIKPFPKSTFFDFTGGESKTFNSLPELAVFLKNYANGVKKVVSGDPQHDVEMALLDAGFKLVDKTSPGTKGGKVYFEDSEGITVIVYKDGAGTVHSSEGISNKFHTAEEVIKWLGLFPKYGAVLTSPEKTSIKTLEQLLGITPAIDVPTFPEKTSIKTLAANYGLDCEESTLGYNVVNYLVIKDKAGDTLFTLRRMKGNYYLMKSNPVETVVSTKEWSILWNKLDEALKAWSATHPQPQPSGKPNELSASEVPGAPKEHNGITPEEYNQIRDAVDSYGDSYGDTFKTQYSQGTPEQLHLLSFWRRKLDGKHYLYLTVGALGNYYQINNAGDKPVFNAGMMIEILKWIHDKLSSVVGKTQTIPAEDWADISHLMQELKFNYASPGGTQTEYVFIKDKDDVRVNVNNFVTFTRKGVFGPVRHKPSKVFIFWFKNVYMKGELPPDGYALSARIIQGLSDLGFVNKDTGILLPHKKIDAIKWFRIYLINLTGGEAESCQIETGY